ncbi:MULTISPECIES: response regulator transcription factor [Rhodococcus]|jgi:FixJ family two-component response regulator|uniref:Nitrogen regulation protein NR(I) n=1 Tax=Rhodococcus aetherivorans TaxID=191292 RepID=N1M387_9NOCA|nr:MULTISPECIES: response regulator [Rhodococcus]ETT23769.1 two component transcriptional regulator, LuxR family [Rhodococcus rhodochrous ATCC 21198]NCL75119.1 Transcriptional regulatory protein TdiR [Rhodococcus sp. YH1]AKE91651.1 LuxR family transcriptional regulator [Rhodococcus aetherivorans]MBC2589508.1 response regulator transcription factor [Rhodococcus aetherivorans]MDV6296381.1 response regulator [Rhodococcus aetherivorans]
MAESADDLRAETTVYVVDDDLELCESVDWLLESIGIRPVICHSGEQFLNAYDGSRPACIVLDVRMPRMSGTRLQEKLNEFAPHVAIIFVSAHGDIRMSVSTLKAGALDFLEKPYDPQRLLDAVQAGVEKARLRFTDHVVRESVRNKVSSLTPRERQILALVVEGLPSQNIARKLGMSVKTVDVHRARIKSKTDADSISTLVRDVLRYGVDVPVEDQ